MQYTTRTWKPLGLQGPLLLLFPAIMVISLYFLHIHAIVSTPASTIIHEQVLTERTTHTSEGSGGTTTTTTTIRQEEHRTAHLGNGGGGGGGDEKDLKEWLSGSGSTRSATHAAEIPKFIVSNARIMASATGTGLMNKFYYQFDNVQLTRDKISVFYDPHTFTPPAEPHWVDMISGNATLHEPPTMIVLKGDLHNTKWFYLPVEYLSSEEHQPRCTAWIEPLAYLLQVRYSYNIWHTWNEGLMGIFQTLRELGQLPLASVGPDGVMQELIDGMGDSCPYSLNTSIDRVEPLRECSKRKGLLHRTKCDPVTERWCRDGAVVSTRRSGGGPIIVPYTASSVMNIWAHLYSSMTEDVRDWSEIEGACFRSLVVGKSSTLNFYQAINSTEPDPETLEKYPRIDNVEARVEAMAVFKHFVHSAQKEYVEEQEAKGAAPWEGYRSRALERLRTGVGPEDLVHGVLDGINAREVPGMLREERNELRQRWKMHDRLVERAVQRYMERYGGASEARAASIEDGRAHQDDYSDDYEGIAARINQGKDFDSIRIASEYEDEGLVVFDDDDINYGGAGGGGGGVVNSGGEEEVVDSQQQQQQQADDEEQQQQQQQQLDDDPPAITDEQASPLPQEQEQQQEEEQQQQQHEQVEKRRRRRQLLSLRIPENMVDVDGETVRPRNVLATTTSKDKSSTGGGSSSSNNNSSRGGGNLRSVPSPLAKKWFDKEAVYRFETPRPVVTYMSRNFFSRGVLNEGDILAYILARYNVTLRVTTFEEPLHLVMSSLASTDVMFGMHGAGWTNGLFIKRGATMMQMFPYGWRLPDDSTLRGYNYREIVLASECPYYEWDNPVRENAFFRRSDFSKKAWNMTYSLHPEPDMPLPTDGTPGNLWIYQNTYVDMNLFGPEIDELLKRAGIAPMKGL